MKISILVLLSLSITSSPILAAENSHEISLCGKTVSAVTDTRNIDDGLYFTNYIIGDVANKEVLLSPLYSGRDLEVVRSELKNFSPVESIEIMESVQKDVSENNIGSFFKLSSNSIDTLLFIKRELSKRNINMAIRSDSQTQCTPGIINISVLKLEPQSFKGTVLTDLSTGSVRGLDTVSHHMQSSKFNNNHPVAAINGGYFVINKNQGYLGDPAGISVIGGELVSEAVSGRPALLIQNDRQVHFDILEDVTTKVTVRSNDNEINVLGVNRQLGTVFNCGLNDGKFSFVSHDTVCKLDDDLVVYDHSFGSIDDVISNSSSYVIIDKNKMALSDDTIINGILPKGYLLLASAGKKYAKKLENIKGKVEYSWSVFSKGIPVPIDKNTYLVNGGPTLLMNGDFQYSRFKKEGWDTVNVLNASSSTDDRDGLNTSLESSKRANFYKDWLLTRHPRTAVGLDKQGNAYFVVVYGRKPLYSDGISVPELAQFFHSLGIQKAVNLDGGGSSAMYLEGKLTGTPSDNNGEREVAEAIVISGSKN